MVYYKYPSKPCLTTLDCITALTISNEKYQMTVITCHNLQIDLKIILKFKKCPTEIQHCVKRARNPASKQKCWKTRTTNVIAWIVSRKDIADVRIIKL